MGRLCDYCTVTSHVAYSIFIFIYSFHMPLFIAIVGLFAKRVCALDRFPIQRAFAYLLLALVCRLAGALASAIAGGNLTFAIIDQDALSWFLLACAVYIGLPGRSVT